MNLCGQPNFAIIFQSPPRLTVSNAFVGVDKGHVEVNILFLSAMFVIQTLKTKSYGLPAVICVRMLFMLYIPPYFFVILLLSGCV